MPVMIQKILFSLAAFALLGTAAAATEQQSAKSSRGDPNKMICRTLTDTGQKLRRTRACHTSAEWQEIRRQDREAIEHIQNSRATNF
jgi:hypothetical protein